MWMNILVALVAVVGFIVFLALSMLLHVWFIDYGLGWTRRRGVVPRYGIIALYRTLTHYDLEEVVGPLSLILVSIALTEFYIRLLMRRTPWSSPNALVA